MDNFLKLITASNFFIISICQVVYSSITLYHVIFFIKTLYCIGFISI
jgi:hypothetical protein